MNGYFEVQLHCLMFITALLDKRMKLSHVSDFYLFLKKEKKEKGIGASPGKYGIVNSDGGNVASNPAALYLSTPLATLVDFPLARTHHSPRSAEVS